MCADSSCLDWMGRIWRRVLRLFGSNRPPPPPPLPPPLFYYSPPTLPRPRSAFDRAEVVGRPEAKRMRFQPPNPETLLQIKKALDELPTTKAVTLIRDLLEGSREAVEADKNCEGQNCSFARLRASEYSSMALTSRLEDEGWCEALLKLLMRHQQDDEVEEEITREMLLLAKSCSKVYRELAAGATETAAWFRNLDSEDNLRIHTTLEKLKQRAAVNEEKDEL